MLDRIRKLLRLAADERGAPAERDSARQVAEDLMRRHGISAAELEEPEVPTFIHADMGPVEDETPFLAMLLQANHTVKVLYDPKGRLLLWGPAMVVGVVAAEWARLRRELRQAFEAEMEEDARCAKEREESRARLSAGASAEYRFWAAALDFGSLFQLRLTAAHREAFYFGVVQALAEEAAVSRAARARQAAAAQRAARSERGREPAAAEPAAQGSAAGQPGLVLVRRATRRPAPEPVAPESTAAAGPEAPAGAGARRPASTVKYLNSDAVERGRSAGRRLRRTPAPASPVPTQEVIPWI